MKDSVVLSQESKYFTESALSTPHRQPEIKIDEVGLEFAKEDTKEAENGEMRSRGKQDNEFESDEDEEESFRFESEESDSRKE